jgi:phosphoribosyl 1,2-cyclic phosphate phosphodiesterase
VHAHFDRVVRWAERVGARRTVLTHMGTDMDWAWLVQHMPPGIEAGVDGLMLDMPAACRSS